MKYLATPLLRLCLITLLITAPPVALAEGFAFSDTQGKTQKLDNYRGKWVLVNIWATWCSPCLQELPELISLHKAHKDKDLVVVSIAMDSGDATKVTPFAKKLGINFPVIIWEWQKNAKVDQEVLRYFGDVEAVPSSFLYNPKGKLAAQHLGGGVTRADIEAYIRQGK